MQTTTVPASRFGWPGQTLEYTVKTDGQCELGVAKDCPDGVQVRVLDTKQVAGGTESRVAVDVRDGALY